MATNAGCSSPPFQWVRNENKTTSTPAEYMKHATPETGRRMLNGRLNVQVGNKKDGSGYGDEDGAEMCFETANCI